MLLRPRSCRGRLLETRRKWVILLLLRSTTCTALFVLDGLARASSVSGMSAYRSSSSSQRPDSKRSASMSIRTKSARSAAASHTLPTCRPRRSARSEPTAGSRRRPILARSPTWTPSTSAVLIGGLTPRREARERLAQAPRRQGQAKPALQHRDRLPVGEPELLVQDRREGQGLGADLRGRCPGRLRRLAGMPALDSGAARDTVADVDPKPRHVDAPDDTLPGLGPRPARARSPRDTSGRPPAAAHRPRCPPAPGPSGAASARTWARPSGRVAEGAIAAGPWRTAPPGASAPAAPWPVPA